MMIRPNTRHTGPLNYNLDRMIDDSESYLIQANLHDVNREYYRKRQEKAAKGLALSLLGVAITVVLIVIFGFDG